MENELKQETQDFLERAYAMVSERLAVKMRGLEELGSHEIEVLKKLALELEIPLQPSEDWTLSPEDEHDVKRASWRPVARTCVVHLLRELLGTGRLDLNREGSIDIDDFAPRVGLEPRDAGSALATARITLLESDLFKKPVRLHMHGRDFSVRRSGYELLAKEMAL